MRTRVTKGEISENQRRDETSVGQNESGSRRCASTLPSIINARSVFKLRECPWWARQLSAASHFTSRRSQHQPGLDKHIDKEVRDDARRNTAVGRDIDDREGST